MNLKPLSRPFFALLCAIVSLSALPGSTMAQDTIEFLSGAQSAGKIIEIRKQAREVVFETKIAGELSRRTYPYSKIHAVQYKGKRYVITRRIDDQKKTRSQKDVEAIIQSIGPTPPEWFDSTPLDFPDTLDLSWPMPAPQPWNNQKNIGQYIWDRINPNESQWRGGVKFLHYLLSRSQDDQDLSERAMRALGGMYFRLFQDYARAAFWWRKAGTSKSSLDGVSLAECYFRLGNKRMALASLDQRRIRVEAIKLLANMGETNRAIEMADAYARQAKDPSWALLAAGDACRAAGQYEQAIAYYRRVLDSDDMRNEQYRRRAHSRAQQSIDAIRQFELLDISKIADGDYEAETLAYEGPLRVKVTVQDGRITAVKITEHKEKQFYSAIRDMPEQIIAKQSVKNVDATSRATITAEAIVSATAKALVGDVGDRSNDRKRKPFR